MMSLSAHEAGMQIVRMHARREFRTVRSPCYDDVPPLYTMNRLWLPALVLLGTLAQAPAYGQADDSIGPRRPARDLPRKTPETVPVGQMTDLTSRTAIIILAKDRDNFTSEFSYQVSVKNMSAEPFTVQSLILVLDKVVDIAGKDSLDRVEYAHVEPVGQDGQTPDGKPYFKVPVGKHELPPYTESQSITVRIRNPNYTIVIRPVFRVLGLTYTAASVGDLIDLLVRKGILTEEDTLELLGTKPKLAP